MLLDKKLRVGSLSEREIRSLTGNDHGNVVTAPGAADADLTASGSANVKGSWSALWDPTSDLFGFWLILASNTTGDREYLLDIGVGPSGGGSEVAVLSNYQWSQTGASSPWTDSRMLVPLFVPGGKRLSARLQSGTSGSQARVRVTPFYRRWLSQDIRSIETYGATTSDSGGTSVDPGSSAGAKGSWTTIGTTGRRITMLGISVGSQGNTRATNDYRFDVGIGSGPTTIIANLYALNSTSTMPVPVSYGPFPVNIPAGTDIKVRSQSNVLTTSPSRLLDFTLYGFSPSR